MRPRAEETSQPIEKSNFFNDFYWEKSELSALFVHTKPSWTVIPRVIALGNFDGLHRGHQLLLNTTRETAQKLGVEACILSFDPHPAVFFNPLQPLFRLTPPEIQAQLAARFGLNRLIHLRFNEALANFPAQDFAKTLLITTLSAKALIIGDDFHFGHRRFGNPERLKDWAAEYGVATQIVPRLQERHNGQESSAPISSSTIRHLLSNGAVREANALLGYHFFVTGLVKHGQKLGRTLGFPTANLAFDTGFALKYGIYAVSVEVESQHYQGVASFGSRPTFDDGAPLLETYLFNFSGDLYGKTLSVTFHTFLRPELKFDSVEALIAQMHQDCLDAKNALNLSV